MRKMIYLISVLPAFGSLVIFNRVEPYVLGLPFVLFWSILWLFLTSMFLLIVNVLDPANKGGEE
ncbi:DUF3311 domain-containing protein [Aneurinibacillus aneurinilyticus]|uniref:DUF3311 domain-containing protein n=1 Tax=Aneurinibacillus aneurinilyticus TaxID=1391 RepID=UPI0023F1938D|nr:DUF3311 domain-containing protein [Aneurinibacillus aneurinilyticus]MED0669696.1 DUF3311 domain-containing protein [Aneurinibacillus aneurinilyticus]